MKNLVRAIDFRKVLVMLILGFCLYNISTFEIVNLNIQSKKFDKQITIKKLTNTIPELEVLR